MDVTKRNRSKNKVHTEIGPYENNSERRWSILNSNTMNFLPPDRA